MTTSTGKRKSSTRAQPKRRTASAVVPTAGPAAEANTVSAATGVTAFTAAAAAQTNGDASARVHVQLDPGLEIKDAEGVHRLLSAALVEGRAIAVDVGRVQAVDTAGAQLLLAFQGEASRRGVTIEFRGESAPLIHTLAVLGLRDKFSFAVSHG